MDNISTKLKEELNKLVEIAKLKQYKLNFSTVLNVLIEQKFDLEKLDEIYSFFNKNNIDIASDDVEEENEEINSITELRNNIKPFDQTKIDITMKTLTLDLILKRLLNSEINLNTEFQRKKGLWDDGKKSRLIESLLLKIPLPAFYFDGTNNDSWLVIDGLQRLTALNEFFINKKLKLKELEFYHDFEDCTIDQLPRSFVRRMEETQIIAYVVNPGTPINVKYNIFKRINTGGLELVPQEIRHALYQGQATKLLEELSHNRNFLEATAYSIKSERMLDREFVLRFIAFSINGIEQYKGFMDDFLNDTMQKINTFSYDEISRIKYDFDRAMRNAYEIFGGYTFRKITVSYRRSPINKALFETWSVLLSKLNDRQIIKLLQNKSSLMLLFRDMCTNDYEFISDLGSGKAISVRRRFEKINKLIEGVLND